jgi:WD40 repeat protein
VSPDGKLVAAGSLDTMVRVWNVQTGQQVERLKGHKDSVYRYGVSYLDQIVERFVDTQCGLLAGWEVFGVGIPGSNIASLGSDRNEESRGRTDRAA